MGAEKSLGMGNRTRIKAEKIPVKSVIQKELALIIKKKKVGKVMTQEELLSPP